MSTTLESITATQNTPTTTILPSSTTDGSETMATSTEKPVTTIEPVISTLESITTTLKSVIVAVEPTTPSEEPAINIIETTTTLEPETTALESKPTTFLTTTPKEAVTTTLETVQVEKEPETTTQELATTTLVAKTTILEPVSTTEPVPEITTTSESVTITTPKPVITTPEPEVTTTEAVVITTEPIATTEPVTMTTDTVTTALEPVTMMTTLPESINNEVGAEPLATDGATTSLSVNEPVTVIDTTTIETESGRPTETESSTETVTSTSETTISSTAPTTGETPTDVAPFTSAISVKSTEVFQENSIDNEITTNDGKTGGNGFAGAPKRIARSQFNVIELNRLHTKPLGPPKRRARSIVDYVIARYYEDQQLPTLFHVPFMGEEEPSFLINGNYREYRINFMKYDSVLPFTYVSYLDAMALSFPLDSDKYYLLLILPRSDTGIDKLICDLRLNGSLRHIVNNLMYRHVVATIPSFMLKGYVTLTPTFQKLGIKKVFEPRQADFSPMTDNGGIYVTNIEQAITVNIRNYVDPNSLENHRRIQQYDPVEFKADHPFLYFVMDSELNVALMAGKVVNPLNSRIS
ncbi:hypothetical protein JTB14_009561 [Gonioctena quinquepunctata]|nr:hypothetical protein JTB14_009561 [Gonioctena quinquepunctata]